VCRGVCRRERGLGRPSWFSRVVQHSNGITHIDATLEKCPFREPQRFRKPQLKLAGVDTRLGTLELYLLRST
jgi:hypothetical protein